jgi:hypothetical protein
LSVEHAASSREHRRSYWKLTLVCSALALACGVAVASLDALHAAQLTLAIVRVLLWLAFTGFALIAISGITCLWRDAREDSPGEEYYARSANQVPGRSLLRRIGLRFLLGPRLRPGDIVAIRSLQEIEATLDANRMLDHLPFMPEMAACCGQIFRVHRRVDKINDMRHKTGLRRLHDTVTLTALRCSGSHHGGCQAECQILWKDQWLCRLPDRKYESAVVMSPARMAEVPPASPPRDADQTYVCQMTELWHASRPMSRRDIRQDVRPLLWGNIGIGAFVVGLLTRLFNRVQMLHGGAGFPYLPPPRLTGSSAAIALDLQPGETVAVRRKDEIVATLVNSRNRGLWFDREMIRFCGQQARVQRRVDRVIHEATGKMVVMKTPCVVLEGMIATGEFLRACPQHEYIFWREIWLRRLAGNAARPAPSDT